MFELTTIVDFEAAHCLRDYPGKCSRLHGHNWQVEVTVAGTKLNELGLLIDFRDLKAEVQKILQQIKIESHCVPPGLLKCYKS